MKTELLAGRSFTYRMSTLLPGQIELTAGGMTTAVTGRVSPTLREFLAGLAYESSAVRPFAIVGEGSSKTADLADVNHGDASHLGAMIDIVRPWLTAGVTGNGRGETDATRG